VLPAARAGQRRKIAARLELWNVRLRAAVLRASAAGLPRADGPFLSTALHTPRRAGGPVLARRGHHWGLGTLVCRRSSCAGPGTGRWRLAARTEPSPSLFVARSRTSPSSSSVPAGRPVASPLQVGLYHARTMCNS